MRRCVAYLGLLLVCGLAGCGASSEEDVKLWMKEERNKTQPQVKPLAAPKQFVPQMYESATAVDPFSMSKLTEALKMDSARSATNAALIAPELKRRREPLEEVPLDAMVYTGFLLKNGERVGLIQIDGLLYRVKVGDYMGQNYGRITKIDEVEMTLREIAQDAAGEWMERTAVLQLKEGSSDKK